MSDNINTIVDKKAYDQVHQLAEELKKSRLELISLLEIAQGGGISFKSIKLPSDLDKQMKKNRQETEQVTAALKEQDRIERALIASLERKKIAAEGTNKALIKSRVETAEINKEAKRQAIISSSLTGEYKRQSTILNTLVDGYRDLVLEQKDETKEARAMKKEIDELDSKLKAVDASVGRHQRNVGNYSSALEGLHPIFGQVNNGLQSMGTSLDDIAASKNPFKDLAAGAIAFGKAAFAFLLSPIGLVAAAIGGLFMLIKGNKDTVIQFDSQLRDVGKTTGLVGKELEGLGNDVVRLSRKLKTVGTSQLMEYAIAAGQLGVKGRKNIIDFAEALAKLETASDISGEEGARSIARLLTLTDGGTQNVKDFGDEIVNLGNNVAATEKEILSNSEAIAQNLGQYDFARKYVLAYGAATKAVGIEAEITGSTIGRTLGQFEKAIRTGQNLDVLVKVTGKSVEELKSQFKDDAAGVFTDFIKGLNNIDKSGGSVNQQLEEIGITAVRDQRVLGSLATRGFGELQKSIELTAKATGSLGNESDSASKKLTNQFDRIGNAWDNLVLTIENGQGIFGRTFAFLSGVGASAIENLTQVLQFSSAVFNGFIAVVKQVNGEILLFVNNLAALSNIEIDFLNPGKMAASAKAALTSITNQFKDGGKRVGDAFMEEFGTTIAGMEKGKVEIGGSETSEDYGGLDEEADKLRTLADINRDLAAAREELLNSNKNTRDGIKEKIKLLEEEAAAWSDQNKKLVQREKDEIAWVEKKNKVLEGSVGYYEALKSALQSHQKNLATTSEEYQKLADNIKLVETAIATVRGEFDVKDFIKLDESEKLELDNFLDKEGVEKGLKSLSNLLGQDHQALMEEFYLNYKGDYESFVKFQEAKLDSFAKNTKGLTDVQIEQIGFFLNEAQMMFDAVAGIMDGFSQRRIDNIDREIEASNSMYDAILENEELTEARRAEIEAEKQKKEDALNEKKRKEQEKQAKMQKAQAAMNVVLQTSMAIISTLAQVPKFDFGISATAIAATFAAVGAAQLAAVLAQPIPKYAKGRKDGKEELAITGDGGVSEVITDKSGKLKAITPNTPTLTHLKKGDIVFPSIAAYKKEYDYQNIVKASIMTSLAHQGEKLSNTEVENTFDSYLLEETIKKAFRGVKMVNNNIVHNDNSALLRELKNQRRRDV